MAVVIRLARIGKKHDPRYRITVADSRKHAMGKYLEIIGTYVPTPKGKEQRVILDQEKLQSWMKKGALPSERVQHVIKLAEGQKS